MRQLMLFLTVVLLLSSCGEKPKGKNNIALLNSVFSLSDVSWFYKKGDNMLIGQAFLRTREGDVITCAGYEVELLPYSDYTAERMRYIYGNDREGYVPILNFPTDIKFYPEYPEFKRIRKSTLCDANGVFKFKNLPDGDYYIVALVYWETDRPNGGFLMKKVSLKGGIVREVILTRQVID